MYHFIFAFTKNKKKYNNNNNNDNNNNNNKNNNNNNSNNNNKNKFKKNRKRDDPRIETCRTPYFNVPASKKTLSIQTKNFLFKRYESNHLITDVRKASISFFQGELLGLKYQMLSEDLLTSYRYASAYPYQLRQSLSTELDKVY